MQTEVTMYLTLVLMRAGQGQRPLSERSEANVVPVLLRQIHGGWPSSSICPADRATARSWVTARADPFVG